MRKVRIAWVYMLIIAVVFCALCLYALTEIKSQKTILTFGMFAGSQWDVPNDDCYKIIDETIEKFEKKYPNVEVDYVSGILKDDYSEWLTKNALKGSMPDVFMVLPEDFNTFSSIGVLKDLSHMIEGDEAFSSDRYYDACYQAGEYDGGQYALPYESVPTFMFVNKTLLEENGVEVPSNDWNWDDFYTICKKLTKDVDGDGITDQYGCYDYNWMNALYSNGWNLFEEGGTSCNLTKQEVKDAIDFAGKIYRISGYQAPTSEDFDLGNVAFRPMTYSEFRTYKPYPWKINKYFDFEWDCICLPAGDNGHNCSEVDNLLMGISRTTEYENLAWEFLKMLTYDEDTQGELFLYSEGISPLKNVTYSESSEKILQESMGSDTGMHASLLHSVMMQGATKEKFRKYDTVVDYMDGEILKLLIYDEDFDSGLQQIKYAVDTLLSQ